MKRFFTALLCLCLLAGCGRTDSTSNTCRAEEAPGSGDMFGKTEKPGESAEPAGETFRIVREEKDGLLLARVGGGPADVYTLSLPDTGVTLDGEAFDRNEPGAYQALPGSTLTGALADTTYCTGQATDAHQFGRETTANN